MGTPKQLLLYKGQSLLRSVALTAIQTGIRPVVLVLGAYSGLIRNEVQDLTVHIVENRQWQEGIASSIRTGLETLLNINPAARGVIFAVTDQPYISSALLNDLIAGHSGTGSWIVSSIYGNSMGTPAFFHKNLFNDLLSLKGDEGAKKIMYKYEDRVNGIPFPSGATDIDTPADFDRLQQQATGI